MRKKKQLQYVAVALSAALVCGPVIPADAAGIQSAGSSRNTESVLSEDIPVAYAARGAAPELSVAEAVSDETAMELAKTLVGEDVNVTSATMYGTAGAFGTFDKAEEIVGFPRGLALSSGVLERGEGENIFSAGYSAHYSMSNSSEAVSRDLLLGFGEENSYYDLAMLEFSYIPEGENVSFQYVLASEEYPQFINSFFDQFVLMVNGENYALVPGTELPVTIGNVNHERNTLFYRGLNDGSSTEGAISDTNFVFNGMTTTFSVSAKVNPGEENTIRIAIADMNDSVYDSAVFIKAGSVQEKPATPGRIEAGYSDADALTLHRINGDNGYVSADVIFLGADNAQIAKERADFTDGNSTVKVPIPDNAVYFYVVSGRGGVLIDPEITEATPLANYMKIYSVTGKVVNMKGTTVPAPSVSEGDVSGGDISGNNSSGGSPDTKLYVILTGDGVEEKVEAGADGSFSFDHLAPGFYNVTAKQGSATMSKLVEVAAGSSTSVECILDGSEYVYKGSSKVEVDEEDAKVMVGSLDDLLKEGSAVMEGLTEEERDVLDDGGSLDLSFQSSVADPESSDAKELKQYAKDNGMGTINIKMLEFGIQKDVTDKEGNAFSSGAVSDTSEEY